MYAWKSVMELDSAWGIGHRSCDGQGSGVHAYEHGGEYQWIAPGGMISGVGCQKVVRGYAVFDGVSPCPS